MNIELCSVRCFNARVDLPRRALCLPETLPKTSSSTPVAFLSPYLFRLLRQPQYVVVTGSTSHAASLASPAAPVPRRVATFRAAPISVPESDEPTAENESHLPSSWDENRDLRVVVATAAFQQVFAGAVDERGPATIAAYSDAYPAVSVSLSVQLPVGVSMKYSDVMQFYVAPVFLDKQRAVVTGELIEWSGKFGEVALTVMTTEPSDVPVIVGEQTVVFAPTAATAPKLLRLTSGLLSKNSAERSDFGGEDAAKPRSSLQSAGAVEKIQTLDSEDDAKKRMSAFGRGTARSDAAASSGARPVLPPSAMPAVTTTTLHLHRRHVFPSQERLWDTQDTAARGASFASRSSSLSLSASPARRGEPSVDLRRAGDVAGRTESIGSFAHDEENENAAITSRTNGIHAESRTASAPSLPVPSASIPPHSGNNIDGEREVGSSASVFDELVLAWSKLENEWRAAFRSTSSLGAAFPYGERDISEGISAHRGALMRLATSHSSLKAFLLNADDSHPYRGITLVFRGVAETEATWALPRSLLQYRGGSKTPIVVRSVWATSAADGEHYHQQRTSNNGIRRKEKRNRKDVYVTVDPSSVELAEQLMLDGLSPTDENDDVADVTQRSMAVRRLRPSLLQHSVVDELARVREAAREEWTAALHRVSQPLTMEQEVLEVFAVRVQDLYRRMCDAAGCHAVPLASHVAPCTALASCSAVRPVELRIHPKRLAACTDSAMAALSAFLDEIRAPSHPRQSDSRSRSPSAGTGGGRRSPSARQSGAVQREASASASGGGLSLLRAQCDALLASLREAAESEVSGVVGFPEREQQKQRNYRSSSYSSASPHRCDSHRHNQQSEETEEQEAEGESAAFRVALSEVQDLSFLLSGIVLPFVKQELLTTVSAVEAATNYLSHKELSAYLAASQSAMQVGAECLPGSPDTAELEGEGFGQRGGRRTAVREELRCFEALKRSVKSGRFPALPAELEQM
jgi:hypothetical protein